MRPSDRVFHLAIPCKELEETIAFYVTALGCQLARRYEDRVTLNFFGDQVVCHLAPEAIDLNPLMYPRHFGITFIHREQFDAVLQRARDCQLFFYQEPFVRFSGRPEEHEAFFLKDPANNLIEFKWYKVQEMIY